MNVLEAYNLIKNYNNGTVSVKVINGVTLSASKGEYIVITGASGSGKSTLLYLLSGLESPTSGEVKLMGYDINLISRKEMARIRRREISFVYQYYNLLPNLTILENITLPYLIDRRISELDKDYLNELLFAAGIEHIASRRPQEVSGGEQQRAAIIRAVFTRPKVIFLDEPTGNLDSGASQRVMELIRKINREYHTAIIMVTHNPDQAREADKIICIQDGTINDTYSYS